MCSMSWRECHATSSRPYPVAIRRMKIILCFIRDGQTISQPYIVALMLEALALSPADRVLEVGTGSGYVTALLAELTAQVFSVERHSSLADSAREVLAGLGYSNVKVILGDGTQGLRRVFPLRCHPRFGWGSRGAERAAGATGGRRKNDHAGGHPRFSAAALDPHGRRPATDHVARTLPLCSIDSGPALVTLVFCEVLIGLSS